jgi:hypothetical protein
MRDELLRIVYWKEGDPPPKPLARDKIEAAKNVVMLDLAVLPAELANGMYKRPIEVLAREIRYEPLPQEVARGHCRRVGARGDVAQGEG